MGIPQELMDRMGIPEVLIRLIRMTTCQTKARVRTDHQTSAPFEFNKGVKQGNVLSTALFKLHSKQTREAQSI